MKKKIINHSSSGEYQKPMIDVIDVLLNGSAVMAMSYTVDGEGTGNDYNPGGGIDIY